VETFSDFISEDISDFIVECVDTNFGFKMIERLGRPAYPFDELYQAYLEASYIY
jgi:hypothetical protein